MHDHTGARGRRDRGVAVIEDQRTSGESTQHEDAEQGRRYLPAGVNRPAVFSLARADLDSAVAFVNALFEHGAPKGIWAFAALPLRLAQATLALVEVKGASAKLSRERVAEMMAALQAAATPAAFLSA